MISSTASKSGQETLAFSESNFNSASYSDFRPTYGQALFDQLLSYHTGEHKLAVDIGCGTGQITKVLAAKFDRVKGFDTSAKMLESATKAENIEYGVAGAEKLPVNDASVDCITVGQAVHWFDLPAWFAEMERVVKPGGTLSFWSYNELEFTDSQEASDVWNRTSHDSDKLGPHWPQPGRTILEDALDVVQVPTKDGKWTDVQRHYTAQRGSSEVSPVAKQVPLHLIGSYMRTASSYHNWSTANGKPQTRAQGGEGDVIDRALDEIKEITGWNDDTIVKCHWPTIAVLARRAA
ncbi:hypothetical protein PYCC9005_000355 [Savitreella phatthalungensis]